jgi:protein-S-isoprenylcysteine O-methyltransferase Ste14
MSIAEAKSKSFRGWLNFGQMLPSTLLVLAPFIPAPQKLMHPSPWLTLLAAWIVILTQPPVTARALLRDKQDHLSALAILVAVNLAMVAPLVDYALFQHAPAPIAWAWFWISAVIVACGLGLRIASIRALGAAFSGLVHIRSDQVLVRSGPYRILRHPSYTAILLILAGICAGLTSYIGLAVLLLTALPAYLYRIAIEERALRQQFSSAYGAYVRSTNALIPFVF